MPLVAESPSASSSWYVPRPATHARKPVTSGGCLCAQLGDSNVGKSSLVLRFVKNQFSIEQCTTVGAAFLQQAVPLDDSEDKIQFGIWDTAGSERYKALAPMVRHRATHLARGGARWVGSRIAHMACD